MDLALKGKVAVVTGASKGLGAAVARQLAAEGMNLVTVARSADALAREAEALSAAHGVQVIPCAVDLASPEGAAQVLRAVEPFAAVHGLVNSAGATKRGDFFSLTEDDWALGYDLKFHAAVRLSRLLWPKLKAGRGAIVSIAGLGGRMPAADFTIGGSVNAALLNFTKALAEVGSRDGVRVNAVNPGYFRTDRLKNSLRSTMEQTGCGPDEAEATLLGRLNVPRFGEPEELGGLIAFLLSPQAAYLNGAALDFDGGARRGI